MMNGVGLKLMFMMCLVLQVVCGEQQIMCLERERQALLLFKAALLDPSAMLSSWSTADCCQWKGIRCSNLTRHVLMLHLHGEASDVVEYAFDYTYEMASSPRYISGEIHKSLMELQQLNYLNLSWNYFPNGGVPEFLASLRNLRYLDLSLCYFGGKIPTRFGSLSHLKYLNLAGNFLEGSIPSQLGNLSNLHHLDLSANSLKGSIPSQLGNLSKLQYLDLSYNDFEGNIPSQLGNLSNLHELYLGGYYDVALKIDDGGQWLSNLISLTHLYLLSIPNLNTSHTSLQMIANLPKLRQLGVIHCSLSDHFILSLSPSKLNFSTSLSVLDLSGNTFTSLMIFQWVLNITSNLVQLDLSDNLLEDSTSNHFGLVMNSLEHLDLSFNNFKGEVLKSFMNICTLHSLYMQENNLIEDRPSIFHNLSSGCIRYSLQELDLTSNKIIGSLLDLSIFSSLKRLDLSGNQLSGKIHEGVKLPSKLESLSIQSNSLEGGIPISFGNACALVSLDMYNNSLSEEFPMIIHHLSGCARYSLEQLYLEMNQIKGTLPNLSMFSSLKTLLLDGNQLNGEIPEDIKLPSKLESLSIQSNSLEGGIPISFGNACALVSLDMYNNSLSEEFPMIIHHLSGCARYSLEQLYLEMNQIKGTLPNLSMFSSLKTLVLDGNQLSGKIPEDIKLPSKLESLSIQSNSLEGGIPISFGNACALVSLDMYNNSLSEEFPMIIHHLSGCASYSLEQLYLGMNQINDTLPDLSIFPSLKILYLDGNKLNGEIPKDIQFPPQLEGLDMQSNSLKSVLTDYHFANMSKLDFLDLSDNSLTLAFTQNWFPPFQLSYIELRSCMLGPTFPKWLQTQNYFNDVDISNAGISDVVPKWFWDKLALRECISMNISYNNLYGRIPNLPPNNHYYSLTLGSNQFEGPVPPFLRNFMFLDLSKNKLSDSISFLCTNGTVETLYQLDLSNNQLSGQIPDCWSHFKSLSYLDLSHNKLSGKIPTSMGSLLELQALLLRNNSLTNEIPLSLRSCKKLVMIDMAENRLSGPIPTWIGSKIQELQILSLGKNHFYGSLPLEICYLRSIQLLDLSLNNLSGQIPKCIQNFTSMAQQTYSRDYGDHSYFVNTSHYLGQWSYDLNAFLMWKGSEQIFKNKGLSLLKNIDFSSNHFSEDIPQEIEKLFGLISLNLSRNNLTGKIPSNIGRLTSLEFLDLSRNQISGSIPSSLTRIDRLTMLDLSHNHLSGEIPISTQLQSFDATSYEDNLDLCGKPLDKLCIKEKHNPEDGFLHHEYSFFTNGFYMSMTLGFVIGFWGSFGSILFKRSWRHAYFKFLNNIYAMVAH